MTIQDVIHSLQTHAAGSKDASGPGLADVLWRTRDEPGAADLQAVWTDLVELFQALLSETATWQEKGVPTSCSYAVAEIIARAAKFGLTATDAVARREAALLVWRVATAWEALMAGDIDGLAGHVSGEEWALRLDSPEGA